MIGMDTKAQARAHWLAVRRSISDADYRAWSAAACDCLWTVPEFVRAPRVLTYVSSKDNEVDTLGIIRRLLEEGREVFVPVMAPKRSMHWTRLHSLDALKPNRFGILEPPPVKTDSAEFGSEDVCLVPGIAFSPTGHRLGYGGGYFDRFLSVFVGLSLGMSFDALVSTDIPQDGHDIPVRLLITESRLIRCPRK